MKRVRQALVTLGATLASVASALPASAQMASAPGTEQGPSLLWVWGWILVAGVIIFVVGTSLGQPSGRK
jgi:hypothetical protein